LQGKKKFKYAINHSIGWFLLAALAPALFLFAVALPAEEILDTAKLKKEAKEFAINRDIFSPDVMTPRQKGAAPQVIYRPPPMPKIEPKPQQVAAEKEMESEVRRSIFYEGYVIKHPKNFALVSANGEFFAVTAGDIVLERIKIIKIDKKIITVEVDSKTLEIQLKGDENNEK
jgi:hypothetical protein